MVNRKALSWRDVPPWFAAAIAACSIVAGAAAAMAMQGADHADLQQTKDEVRDLRRSMISSSSALTDRIGQVQMKMSEIDERTRIMRDIQVQTDGKIDALLSRKRTD